jgi:integrase
MPKQRRTRPGLEVVSRPGTQSLYLRGTVRGQRIFESAGTDNPKLAEEARATREAELYRGALHGAKKTVTFAQAALKYIERPNEGRPVSQHTRVCLGRILRHLGPTITCDQIDQTVIDDAGRAICRKGAKATTILRAVISPTKAILNFAARRGWCGVPVFETVKGGGKRTDWITPAEAEAMVKGASPHLQPLLTFMFCTGARVGEAVALQWGDVDLRHSRATLRETKNGDDRVVDLPTRAVTALANLPGDRSGQVFRAHRGAGFRRSCENKWGSGGGQIRRSFKTALRAAKIGRHLTPHHCRHTWATWHYVVHKDIIRLRLDGGWKTISQCERYTKLAPDGLRDEVEAFWKGVPTTKYVQDVSDDRISI